MKEGHEFESETDTEAVAKLLKHVYDMHKDDSFSFSELVAQVIQPLVSLNVVLVNNNNNNQICKAPECQKTSVALAYRNSRAN